MAAQVRLKNTSATPFTGTLYHESYCAKGGPCGCSQEKHLTLGHNPETGERGMKRAARRVPVGFSIPPWDTSEPMHPAIRKVPGVKEALAKGTLKEVPVAE